ncbi:MAG: DUF6323 family protein [Oscillibacter sp.]|jgi:hypothetical protein|nr:DUF6323 family protein [Oscillibacter sp.]
MEELSVMSAVRAAIAKRERERCNEASGRFGLTLTEQQGLALAQHRSETLKACGRVEFGGSILPKLVRTFCDSPYLMQENYESELWELQDLFYAFKNESGETLTDEELLLAMRSAYNGPAGGAAEYLAGVRLSELCRESRTGTAPEERRDSGEVQEHDK